MLTILGPAKTIDMSAHGITEKRSNPAYLDKSEVLVNQLRQYNLSQLKKLMKISDRLAAMTLERYAGWHRPLKPGEGQQAMLAFSGEVFNGLQARSLREDDLLFAQEHVRILSGLYGVLKPLDMILPYRLEMGTKMKNPGGKNLYEYWDGIIPDRIIQDTAKEKPPVLINLASNEYFKSIHPASFPHRIITPVFRETDGEGYRHVTVYAKKARGMMLRFILQNRINDPEELLAFDLEGYSYRSHLSGDTEWVFCR